MEAEMSVVVAAEFVGLSERGLRDAIGRGEVPVLSAEPVRLDAEAVQTFRLARRVDALSTLQRRRRTLMDEAVEARHVLRRAHAPGTGLPGEVEQRQRFRLGLVSSEAKAVFGLAVLRAVAAAGDRCGWCVAREKALEFGGWAPSTWSEPFGVLLGDPCETCRPGLIGPVMAELREQVHRGGTRPSAGRSVVSVPPRSPVAPRAAVRPAARPQDDDGGRALVQRRLREARARLKDAKRRNDRKYTLQLAQMVRDLERDAARVDGRAVTASARPGRLACGHRLDARCSCPRRASRRER